MTAPAFPVSEETVRRYIGDTFGTVKYDDATVGSNLRTAVATLERRTHRYIGDRTQTLTFTTQGKPYVTIPGLRTAGAITLAGAGLTADAGYWLIPDSQQSGLFTGIQLRGFTNRNDGPWWLASPSWFDTNMDSPYHPANRGGGLSSLPNDLVIPGDWGFDSASTTDWPDDALAAIKVLAGHLTVLSQANSAGILQTLEGNQFDLSGYPNVVLDFIREWAISPGVGS